MFLKPGILLKAKMSFTWFASFHVSQNEFYYIASTISSDDYRYYIILMHNNKIIKSHFTIDSELVENFDKFFWIVE